MQEIWNIVILSSKDKDYQIEYEHLMADITELEVHSNIRYIVYEFDHDNGPANTRIFEFAFTNTSVEVSAENCRDIYKKEDLINFFKTIVVRENSDTILNRYMIITWGHGAGLGVFAMIEELPKTKVLHNGFEVAIIDENVFAHAKESAEQILFKQAYLNANNLIPKINLRAEISPIIEKFKISKDLELKEGSSSFFENFKNELTDIIPLNLKMLTGADLADIFSNSFPEGTKIDALITVNCYTQCFEFGNRLRDKVSLLVAPQTMIPFEGINYSKLFAFINNNQEKRIEIKDIARNLTSTFWAKYESTPLNVEFSKKYPGFPLRATSFSCNDLASYFNIEKLLGETGSILHQLRLNRDIKFIIIKARNKCQDLTAGGDYGIIDFTVFFQNMITELNIRKKEFNKQEEINSIDRLNTLYVDFITNLRTTCCLSLCMSQPEAYIQHDKNITDRLPINLSSRSPFFLSIFFPNEKSSSITSLLNPSTPLTTGRGVETSFNYDNWILFVQKLFK